MSDRLSVSSRVDMEETASELECLPFGVHHDDEGVCLLVRMGPHRILLDCGLADVSPLVKGLKNRRVEGVHRYQQISSWSVTPIAIMPEGC